MDTPTIVINFGAQRDGCVFRPKPTSRVWLEQHYPDEQHVASVFIGFDQR